MHRLLAVPAVTLVAGTAALLLTAAAGHPAALLLVLAAVWLPWHLLLSLIHTRRH